MRSILISFLALAACTAAFAEEPFAGTWKLNLAKSKYSPGMAPKEATLVIREVAGAQVEQTVSGVGPDGKPLGIKQTVNQTGGVWKFQQGAPPAGTLSVILKIGPRELYGGTYVADKQVSAGHATLSADGKTLVNTVKGVDPQGKPFENMTVFERQ